MRLTPVSVSLPCRSAATTLNRQNAPVHDERTTVGAIVDRAAFEGLCGLQIFDELPDRGRVSRWPLKELRVLAEDVLGLVAGELFKCLVDVDDFVLTPSACDHYRVKARIGDGLEANCHIHDFSSILPA